MDIRDSWEREYAALTPADGEEEIAGRDACRRRVLAYMIKRYGRGQMRAEEEARDARRRVVRRRFRDVRLDFGSFSLSLKLAAVSILLGWLLALGVPC